jgi:ketopantoate hydroxymethyltransferase
MNLLYTLSNISYYISIAYAIIYIFIFLIQNKYDKMCTYLSSMARCIDEYGINGILVGDSLGMPYLGYKDTLSVTMDEILHPTKAVARGVKNALLVSDMPFMSYQASIYDAVKKQKCLNLP